MEKLKIDKPIRLIELFAGVGSQAKALSRLGANFEHYRVCE
jgi:DNA (cytosine-5)-methyltransferase 1